MENGKTDAQEALESMGLISLGIDAIGQCLTQEQSKEVSSGLAHALIALSKQLTDATCFLALDAGFNASPGDSK